MGGGRRASTLDATAPTHPHPRLTLGNPVSEHTGRCAALRSTENDGEGPAGGSSCDGVLPAASVNPEPSAGAAVGGERREMPPATRQETPRTAPRGTHDAADGASGPVRRPWEPWAIYGHVSRARDRKLAGMTTGTSCLSIANASLADRGRP